MMWCSNRFQPHVCLMRAIIAMGCLLAMILPATGPRPSLADDESVAFAVVSEPPKDRTRIAAKVAIEGTVSDLKLLASDHILSNLIWKKLEICHAMKLEGRKVQDGFRVSSVRVIEGAMLPMVLQGYAGDCLLKKALEIAPFAD
ncbi:MAG: hypothetical protein FJ247_05095 [Nitrospira sp.]|nr:hypothetical protein [Nitrospira sp.]